MRAILKIVVENDCFQDFAFTAVGMTASRMKSSLLLKLNNNKQPALFPTTNHSLAIECYLLYDPSTRNRLYHYNY